MSFRPIWILKRIYVSEIQLVSTPKVKTIVCAKQIYSIVFLPDCRVF